MLNLTDIYPLTGFLREHKDHLARLHASGRPEVLTVNGRASVVVQDAVAYQKLVDAYERLELEDTLRKRLASIRRGDPGVPVDEALSDIRNALDLDSA